MKTNKLKQKSFSALLAIAMTLTLIPCFAAAQEENVISTADELISLAYSVNKSDFSQSYRLANDIDMSQANDERIMKAIGSYSGGSDDIAFNGVFDGGGHKLINLSTTSESLFGYIGENGIVKNLILENAAVHYRQNAGSKYPAALVSLNYGEIQNCFSVNSTVISDYCSPAGGLIGTNFGNVSACGVYGGSVSFAVSKTGTSHGGFVGNQRGGYIGECFSTAVVDAKKWAGGFAGKIEDGVITDCYALGNVSGSEECGGFAGAFMNSGILKNVYAANKVTAANGGGLAGGKGFSFAAAGAPENCWYCSDFSLPQNSDSFENSSAWAKSADEMRSSEFASALSDKWAYDENVNGGYPYLINAVPPVPETNMKDVTAKVMIAAYDKTNHEFYKLSEPFNITIQKNTVTVKDILDAAALNGNITYAFGKNEQSGQVITINNITPKSPDGWMFCVNGNTSPVGASSAIISDGDALLWYVGAPENGYTAPDWDSIGSAEENITIINNAADLLELTAAPDKWNGNYKLADNIDLSGIEFSPIGNSETPFSGNFDGNGFEISNLTITGDKNSQNIGMFGLIRGARLKNINLNNINITGGSIVGGLAGAAQADEAEKSISFISDCHVSGIVTAIGTSYAKQTDAGGLIGINDSEENKLSGDVFLSVIDNCTADVTVIGNTGAADISDAGHIGGLVGLNKGTISNSSATGDVTGGNTTGGFVGSNYGGNIYSSNAAGNVSGAFTIGGFAGSAGLYSLIENSYSTGDITALSERGSNYGGFAGTIGGKVKNCVSSGTLTTGWSYNGGFAGRCNSVIWSYNDDFRSLSNCYGNAVTSSGERIKALGNYIGGVHAPTDIAAEEIGVDKDTAENKIKEMLNASIAENKLEAEASKYKASSAIPASVQTSSDITSLVARLNANVSADNEISVSYKSYNNTIKADSSGYTLISKPEKDMRETVMLSLALNNVEYEKPITVSLYSAAKQTDKDKLLENIAKQYASSGSDYWKIVNASAYNNLFGSAEISDKTKSDFVSQAVQSIMETDEDTTLAMNIIALRSLGYNPSEITAEDGTKINALEKLAGVPSTGNNGDAYRLLAYNSCGYDNKTDTDSVINRLLTAQINEKGWSNNNDNIIDADSTGAVILGLSPYYNSNNAVQTAADSAAEYLSSLMQADGNIKSSYKESNYGTNANTSAICAMGLEALGINIKTDSRFVKNSISLFDGIISFASDDETGFVYEYGSEDANELSTKQAALAVMASKKSGNILDFSDMPNNAINLSKSADNNMNSSSGGGSPSGKSDNTAKTEAEATIEVYFTLIGDTVHRNEKHKEFSEWLKEIRIEIAENSTARDVIEKALKDNSYSAKGFEKGYISEITTPDGTTLREYSNGEQSGWMYSINGEGPSVGINDYKVKNGDKITVYYSDSWQTASFTDVSPDDWFFAAAEYAAQNGLIKGYESGEFMPDEKLTRSMAVTIIGRLGGAENTKYNNAFSDVSETDWFAPFTCWAAENGIVSGIGGGLFAPNDNVTREQLAVILYRYAKLKGTANETITADLTEYSDSAAVSDWAENAIRWAVGEQLIRGTDKNSISPKDTATRAQFAMILTRLDSLTK